MPRTLTKEEKDRSRKADAKTKVAYWDSLFI